MLLVAGDEQSIDKRLLACWASSARRMLIFVELPVKLSLLNEATRGSWLIVWINCGVTSDLIARHMSQRYFDIEKTQQMASLRIKQVWQLKPPSPASSHFRRGGILWKCGYAQDDAFCWEPLLLLVSLLFPPEVRSLVAINNDQFFFFTFGPPIFSNYSSSWQFGANSVDEGVKDPSPQNNETVLLLMTILMSSQWCMQRTKTGCRLSLAGKMLQPVYSKWITRANLAGLTGSKNPFLLGQAVWMN